jgi:Tol biopolymer transport system component
VKGAPNRDYYFPRLSPDEKELAVAIYEKRHMNLWKYDLNTHVSTQLTFGPFISYSVDWIPPNHERISFCAWEPGTVYMTQLYSTNVEAIGEMEPVLPVDLSFWRAPLSWSPDGRHLAYGEGLNVGSIWILPFGDDGEPGVAVLLFDEKERVQEMTFHPSDGCYIAYSSWKTGRPEVYIREFSWGSLSKGWVKRISTEGGTEPRWSRDGSKLFYRSDKGMVEVTIDFKPDGTADLSKSQVLFDDSIYLSNFLDFTNYDITSDERFVMVKGVPTQQINVVLNFSQELKRLTPTRKR